MVVPAAGTFIKVFAGLPRICLANALACTIPNMGIKDASKGLASSLSTMKWGLQTCKRAGMPPRTQRRSFAEKGSLGRAVVETNTDGLLDPRAF